MENANKQANFDVGLEAEVKALPRVEDDRGCESRYEDWKEKSNRVPSLEGEMKPNTYDGGLQKLWIVNSNGIAALVFDDATRGWNMLWAYVVDCEAFYIYLYPLKLQYAKLEDVSAMRLNKDEATAWLTTVPHM